MAKLGKLLLPPVSGVDWRGEEEEAWLWPGRGRAGAVGRS